MKTCWFLLVDFGGGVASGLVVAAFVMGILNQPPTTGWLLGLVTAGGYFLGHGVWAPLKSRNDKPR
jgi:hypothetical protein